jgi:hypothetical protein
MPLCRASAGTGGTFLFEERKNKRSSITRAKIAKPMVFFMSTAPPVGLSEVVLVPF